MKIAMTLEKIKKEKGQPLILSQAGLNGWPAHKPRQLQAKNFEEFLGHGVLPGFVVASRADEFSTIFPQARYCDHRACESASELPHERWSGRLVSRHTRVHDDGIDVWVGGKLLFGFLDGKRADNHHLAIELAMPFAMQVLLVFDNQNFLAHLLSSFQRAFGLISSGRGVQISYQVIINYLGLQERQKIRNVAVSNFLTSWIKKFSSPKIKIWFEPMFFSGFFCGFQRCGSAAFPNFRGGIFSAKCVRTNSRILHQVGKVKEFWFASLRSAANLYSILGVKTNWRSRILGEENFLILNF